MAIMGPSELPSILKVKSEELKKYVLSRLGFPTVEIEIEESQFESVLRTTGDWIAHYFPKEQKLAFFNTVPLQGTYPLPTDAYWVQEAAWDPATTRIGDVFGAESFLFCYSGDSNIVREDGKLVNIKEWDDSYKALTPYGPRRLVIEEHLESQRLVSIEYEGGSIECTPNHPLKTDGISNMINGWECAEDCKSVTLNNGKIVPVIGIADIEPGPTYTVHAIGAHCLFICKDGESVVGH